MSDLIQHPSAPVVFDPDPRQQPVLPLRGDECLACGFPMAAHFDPDRHFISCETLIDRSQAAAKRAQETERIHVIAHLLALMDDTDKLLESSSTLRRHYERCAWIARNLSTMGPDMDLLQELTSLQGANGCAEVYYADQDMSAPYLTSNQPERILWRTVFGGGFKAALDFLGRVGGDAEHRRVRGIWRAMTVR
jgi:hypothetical protein